MDSDQSPVFGTLLRKLRLARGLSQEALADLARMSTEAIGALERGNRKLPHRQTLTLLIEALDLEASDRALLEAAAARRSVPRRRSVFSETAEAPEDEFSNSNLPQLLTNFIGRESELSALVQLLAENRFVTVTGPGGVGKTRTSIQVAGSIVDRYRDGVWLVDLAPLRDAGLVPQAIASVLEIREISGSPLVNTISSKLRVKHLLLVIDNCEHVLDEAAKTIEKLLNECSGVSILATSRQPLGVHGEIVFRLPALQFPEETATVDSTSASQFAAIELFVQCAKAADSSFALTNKNATTIGSICRHIDGIPFAIELAAAKVSALSVSQIAEYLKYRFSLLSGGSRTALPRQQTLRALLDWSYDLLSDSERSFLSHISVFSGSFTAEAAAAVFSGRAESVSEALAFLIALVEKSLVVSEFLSGGENRFRLLETTRVYAREHLMESGNYDLSARREAAYVLSFARSTSASFGLVAQEEWITFVRPEIENVRSALEWALAESHDVAVGSELAALFCPFWESFSYTEGKRWLTAARGVIDQLDARLAARVLLEYIRGLQFDEETIRLSEEAVNAYRHVEDPLGLYQALEYRAQLLINIGLYDEALEMVREAEELSPDEIDDASKAHLAVVSGFAHVCRHEFDAASAELRRADALVHKDTQHRETALILRGFGEIALARNRPSDAVEFFLKSLKLLEQSDNVRMVGVAQYRLAHALLLAGRVEEAREFSSSALKRLLGAQLPLAFIEAATVNAAASLHLGKPETAALLLGFAKQKMTALPFRSAFLVDRLRELTIAELEGTMRQAEFDERVQTGMKLDDLAVVAEVC